MDGQAVDLEPKPLELLGLLLSRSGEVVTKAECLETLWVDRVVTESALVRCVYKLRQALLDDDQSIVRTVHGYGYRLGVPTEVQSAQAWIGAAHLSLEQGQKVPRRPGWKLVERLGGGTHSEAWLAEHKTGERRVFKFCVDALALVSLKREITLARLLKTHYGEREDLVSLLDWNLDESPYFIESEHCGGGSLLTWVGASAPLTQWPLEARIGWISSLADTVAAAHAIGVLHKDLKPANVFVVPRADGSPAFKIGDWGAAHLADTRPLAEAGITALGFTQIEPDKSGRSGTVLYQPPEVIAGQPASVQADIYALGVMLYQLAVGDLRRPLPADWADEIDDGMLREDLGLCLAGRPERRLASALELADRLRRRGERRFRQQRERERDEEQRRLQASVDRLRRRRRAMTAIAGTLGAALLVSGGLLWRVELERQRTREESNRREAVSRFLVDDLLAGADPAQSGASDVSMRTVLDRASRTSAQRFATDPVSEAAVRVALGKSYYGLGALDAARGEFKAALDQLANAQNGADDLSGLDARLGLANVELSASDYDAATEVLAPLLASTHSDWSLRAGLRQADVDRAAQRLDDARSRLQSLQPRVAAAGATDAVVMEYYEVLAAMHRDAGEFDDAIAAYERAITIAATTLGAHHPTTLIYRRGLAGAYYLSARYPEALPIFREVLVDTEALLGPDHLSSARVATEIGLVLLKLGQLDESEALQRRALAIIERTFGEVHPETRTALNNLALVSGERKDYRAELPLYEKAYRVGLQLDPRDMNHLVAASNYARTLQLLGRADESVDVLSETLGHARAALPQGHWVIGYIGYFYADALGAAGRTAQARAAFSDCLHILEASLGADDERTQKARAALTALEARS